MGCDCRIVLRAPLADVASAIGILLGKKHTFHPEHGWIIVDGVNVRGLVDIPECAMIDVDRVGQFMWHYEFEGSMPGLMPRATARNIALGRALCQTFGGTLQPTDRTPKDKWEHYVSPQSPFCLPAGLTPERWVPMSADLYAEAGEAWYARQGRLAALRPLTDDDINAARPLAAYQE